MYFNTHPDYSYKPYMPKNTPDATLPYVLRLAPSESSLDIEWVDPLAHSCKALLYLSYDMQSFEKIEIDGTKVKIPLESERDGTFYIETLDGRKSKSRKFRSGFFPGKVVNYVHPEDKQYIHSGKFLASPSLLRTDNGDLLALMDVFANGHSMTLSILFRSRDEGESWEYVTDIFPAFWGTLFKNKGKIYIAATSCEYGDAEILESLDNGESWHGITLDRAPGGQNPGYHRAPTPVVKHGGRIYLTFEYGCWQKKSFIPLVFSASEDADLMKADSWSVTEPFYVTSDLDGINEDRVGIAIEGNAVVGPDGNIYNILRHGNGKALSLRLGATPTAPLEFDRFFDAKFGNSKFHIQYHNGIYYAMGNFAPYRNELLLYTSCDLVNWEIKQCVVDLKSCPANLVGCQYPSFFIEGDTAYVLARTGINGALNYHDSNAITFHKIKI